jgi:hypothetical protein
MTRNLEKLFVLTGLLAVTALLFTVVMQELARRRGPEPNLALKISATRNVEGLLITNDEDTAVDQCEAIVFDEGEKIWKASVARPVVQSETFQVSWSQFKSDNHTMPAHVGLKRPLFSISCVVRETRRSAGVTLE